ncbi:hypothetical protein [Litchfieldia alkalitelluris]|uniref:hypothetical protein n=1 Tax=Litchfieldia alkalitelluris TaxID=304268 RepID=UPI0009989076|nr:hypothetical protein [Litchfieldia alkalitelluris]
MNQEKLVAKELNQMINEDKIPLSITEDVHEICRSLISGEMKVSELQDKDSFIVSAVQQAMSRIDTKNSQN